MRWCPVSRLFNSTLLLGMLLIVSLDRAHRRQNNAELVNSIRKPIQMALYEFRKDFRSSTGEFANTQNSTDHLAVFYNIFIPPTLRNPTRVVNKIILEQLHQVEESAYRKVFYNLIGYNWTKPLCSKSLNCTRIKHLTEGNEVDTLQDLYEYCINHQNDTVVYIHDKGSFHAEKMNRKNRRIATKAALSYACHSHSECNVCATRMQFNPHWHAPSNMWAAKCDYIHTLIPPREYETRRRSMFGYLRRNAGLFPCLNEDVLQDAINYDGSYKNETVLQSLALGRFAYETWVYSSPYLTPCHVLDSKQPLSTFGRGFDAWQPVYLEGPGTGVGEYRGIMKISWYHKRGRLWEMRYMYNTTPPPKSWFHKAYRNEKANAEPKC